MQTSSRAPAGKEAERSVTRCGPSGPAWVLSLAMPRHTGAQWSLSLPWKMKEPASHETELLFIYP